MTTPGGRTYTSGSAGGVGVGPAGGVRAGGVGGSAVRGPYGAAAGGRAGGVVGGPFGGVAVGGVGGVGYGRVGVGHVTSYYSPTVLRTQAGYVRSWGGYSCFTTSWYRAHPVAWTAPRWRVANYWVAPPWSSVSVWCGVAGPPIVYDYGSTVVYQENVVYVNGERVATAEQYADQAQAFADVGRQGRVSPDEEWQPLGVFGMLQSPDEKVAQHIVQLAVNKAGLVRGNYYDAVADNTLPVYGSVDPRTQRVAWSIGEKKTIVYETGLNNLMQEQTTLLAHYGKERTQQMILVRLEEPRPGAN